MKEADQLDQLLELAGEVGLAVRFDGTAAVSARHPGGCLVRLRGREVLFLDPSASVSDRLDAVCDALRGRAELEDRYLPPALRERLGPAF